MIGGMIEPASGHLHLNQRRYESKFEFLYVYDVWSKATSFF